MKKRVTGIQVLVVVLFCYTPVIAQPITTTVPLDTLGNAQAVVELDARFASQTVRLSSLGLEDLGGDVISLPPGYSVLFPAELLPAESPLLPISIKVADPPLDIASQTLVLKAQSQRAEALILVTIDLPKRSILKLEVPDNVVTALSGPTLFSFKVRNEGNVTSRVQVVMPGWGMESFEVMLAAGEEQTIHRSLQTISSGVRVLRLELKDDFQTVSRSVQVHGAGQSVSGLYGLRTQLSTLARLSNRGEELAHSTRFSLEGNLSRYSTVATLLSLQSPNVFNLNSAHVSYFGTRIAYAKQVEHHPAGDVGEGAYFTQKLPFGVASWLDVGLAIPLAGNPRTGVNLFTPHLQGQLSALVDGHAPVLAVQSQVPPFHARVRYSPDDPSIWLARAEFATRPLSVGVEATQSEEHIDYSLELTTRQLASGVGNIAFGIKLNYQDTQFKDLVVKMRDNQGYLALKVDGKTQGQLEAAYKVELSPYLVQLKTQLNSAGWGRLSVLNQVSTDFALLRFGVDVSTDKAFGLQVGGSRGFALNNAYLSLETDLWYRYDDGSKLFSALSLNYADLAGWEGVLRLEYPIYASTDLSLALQASFSDFHATPAPWLAVIDGPDETERSVTVVLTDGVMEKPIEGIRLSGCGSQRTTDDNGRAAFSGFVGACKIDLDKTSLPSQSFIQTESFYVAAAENRKVVFLKTSELEGSLSYIDELGNIHQKGPSKAVRVLFSGPVERFVDVVMPSGKFKLENLPVGDYSVMLYGQEVTRLQVKPQNKPLHLTTEGPRLTTMDRASITPFVKVTLDTPVLRSGEETFIEVTSDEKIVNVQTVGSGNLESGETFVQTSGAWLLRVVAPQAFSGVLVVNMEIKFEDNSVARRTVNVFVN